ncbi:alpha/beta hydrolase [Arthrobacter sp. 18067]|uniref:alpha/beta hydrolase n=1 Tax=Arthrobacter sp. 18067 TaxID=2681413 RepID=UPI0013577C6B|nr:alpha/beta fold hydrolase [Arthrobacter sp. 18067]
MTIQRIVLDSDALESNSSGGQPARPGAHFTASQSIVPEMEGATLEVLHVLGGDNEFRALEGLRVDECDQLNRHLERHPVEALVLDSCWTPETGELLAKGARTVIGIPARIGRSDANQFLSSWFQAMAEGAETTDAFERAFMAIAAYELPDDVQPVLFSRGIDAYGFRAARRGSLVDLAFGTNRTVDARRKELTSRPGPSLRGTCQVKVFSTARIGRPRRSLGRDDTPILSTHTLVDNTAFTDAMTAALDADTTNRRAVLVYVHGFNTGFPEAAQRAAQIHVDLTVPGATVLFSWPSRGSGNQRAYTADEDSVIAAERPLYDLLAELHNLPNVGPVHVLAHSMGCRAAVRVVVRAAEAAVPPFELGELILAAPDVSESYFTQVSPLLPDIARRTTVYTSLRDRALRTSEFLHNAARVGNGKPSLFVPEIPAGMTFVDAEKVDVSFIGHGYYAASAPVLRDLSWLLYGLPADSRFGIESNTPGRLTLRSSR